MNIEFHNALISHFQQEGLASFLVQDIGSSHDLTNLERLFVQSVQDIVSIIQHAFSLTITSDSARWCKSVAARPAPAPAVLDRDEGLRRSAGKHVTFCVPFWIVVL
jgi:hypothetical protein